LFESVTIENFRGIEKLEVPLSPLTVLVGPNGVGKSSVLDAISLGGMDLRESVDALVQGRRQGLADPALWLVRYGQTAGVVMLARAGAEARVELRAHKQTIRAWRRGSGDWEALYEKDFGADYQLGHSGAMGPIPVQFVDSARPYDPGAMSARYTDIQRRGLKSKLEAFLRVLEPRVRSLVMDATTAGTAEPAVDLEGVGSRPLALAGDGVRFMTQLVVGLMQSQGGTALLEEPETHLHPAGLSALTDAVLQQVLQGGQVVLTTHSAELVDQLFDAVAASGKPTKWMRVIRLRREASGIVPFSMRGDEIRVRRDQMHEDLR
jgi:predicted ATPase